MRIASRSFVPVVNIRGRSGKPVCREGLMRRFGSYMLNMLADRGRSATASLAATLVAEDRDILGRVDMERVVRRAEEQGRRLPWLFYAAYKLSLLAFEYGLPPLAWRFRRFSRQSWGERIQYAERWERSRSQVKRNLFALMKSVTLASLLREPDLLEWIGYGEAMRDRLSPPEEDPVALGASCRGRLHS